LRQLPRKPLAVAPALLLVIVSLWEVCATRRAATAVPDDADWDAAAKVVRDGYKPGDLIVFAPDWVDPVGRLHLGDLIPVDMAARMDAAKYGRIWELSIRGARSPDTAGLSPAQTTDVDGVTVRRFERAPAVVVADVRDRLATVVAGRPGDDRSSFGASGARPTLELAEVGFEPHRCLQITPAPNAPARITFPAMPLGGKLVGYVGLADIFKRREIRTPGRLDVEIGGTIVASATPGIDDGWVRFEATTTPGTADVTFIASATEPDRLICFAAEARQ
jgi:hypothetical protein